MEGRYVLELAYNGQSYHGWQIQDNAETVQAALNHALGLLLRATVNLVGAGRTDTGVHASHFVAHFDWSGDPINCQDLAYKLNRFFNSTIRIDRIEKVSQEFHARFSASARTYHYIMSAQKQPYLSPICWEYEVLLDIEKMNQAAFCLKEVADFTSFARLHGDQKTNICSVSAAEWRDLDGLLVFKITADRFLRNMVRAIVGSLVDVGLTRISIPEFQSIIAARNRSEAGQSAPAKGLFLSEIQYPERLFQARPQKPFCWFF